MLPLLSGLLITLSTMTFSQTSPASNSGNEKRTAVIWINSWYGPNNSGVGICGRYASVGIGATVFSFVGDTASDLPVRPGAIGISMDSYLIIDFNHWLAIYGNLGLIARLGTYRTSEEIARNYEKHTAVSVGGGFQVSLASHLMLGIGYNGVVDLPKRESGSTYNTISSIVAQAGYRL